MGEAKRRAFLRAQNTPTRTMFHDPNIEVEMTDRDRLHCFMVPDRRAEVLYARDNVVRPACEDGRSLCNEIAHKSGIRT